MFLEGERISSGAESVSFGDFGYSYQYFSAAKSRQDVQYDYDCEIKVDNDGIAEVFNRNSSFHSNSCM